MTLHDGNEFIGLICFHVDDVLVAGRPDDPRWQHMQHIISLLYEWGSWESGEFEQCGCRV